MPLAPAGLLQARPQLLLNEGRLLTSVLLEAVKALVNCTRECERRLEALERER